MELTPAQKLTIDLLSNSPLKKTFYWTGGTLLAYHYLHHRKSLDLDFFSQTAFSLEMLTGFIQKLKETGGFNNIRYQKVFDRHEFLLENGETLRLEFVYYNHEKKPLGKKAVLFGVNIDSLKDLAANKTMAYFDRNEPKDLFDIYFLIRKKEFSPSKLLDLVRQKFGVTFNEASFWSEAFKTLPLLHNLRPLILEKGGEEKDEVLKSVENYFREGSAKFLRKSLD